MTEGNSQKSKHKKNCSNKLNFLRAFLDIFGIQRTFTRFHPSIRFLASRAPRTTGGVPWATSLGRTSATPRSASKAAEEIVGSKKPTPRRPGRVRQSSLAPNFPFSRKPSSSSTSLYCKTSSASWPKCIKMLHVLLCNQIQSALISHLNSHRHVWKLVDAAANLTLRSSAFLEPCQTNTQCLVINMAVSKRLSGHCHVDHSKYHDCQRFQISIKNANVTSNSRRFDPDKV